MHIVDLKVTTPNGDRVCDIVDSYEDIIDINEEISKIQYVQMCFDNLISIEQLANNGGMTKIVYDTFGLEQLSSSVEATAGDIGRAIWKGLVAFGKLVLNLISKVVTFIQKFCSSERKNIDGLLESLSSIIPDIQKEPIGSGIQRASVKVLSNICKKHFSAKVVVPTHISANASKDEIRTEYLSEFNKTVTVDAVVGNDYKLEYKPKYMDDTDLNELGYKTVDDFRSALNDIKDAKNSAQATINNLKLQGTAIDKMIKSLEGNRFHNAQENKASVQVAYVYCRIVFNDVAMLVQAENKIHAIVTKCESISKQFAKTAE